MDKIFNWLKWTGLVTVLLNFFLVGHAWYYDKKAQAFVMQVHGSYIEDTWQPDGSEGTFLVQWDKTESPPTPNHPNTTKHTCLLYTSPSPRD